MDRLHAMNVFLRVAEAGSFAAAAKHLDLARSMVTRTVAGLEAHLGTKLIARSTRSLRLTSEGAVYLERCRDILSLVEAAEGDLAGNQFQLRGLIRVGVPLSFGVRHVAPLVGEFLASHPGLDLDLDFDDRRVNLIETGLDMAIRITSQLDPTQVARRIGRARFLTLASPDYLARHGRPRHPAELAQHECLDYTGSSRPWAYWVDGEWRQVPVRGRLRANNGDALLDAAVRGLGICAQPSFIAAPALRSGALEVVLPEYPTPELGIHAVFPGNRHLSARVRAFTDYLAARMGDTPSWELNLPPQTLAGKPFSA